jgi:hypothetical protein
MSGVMTTTVDHLIRSEIWSTRLKEIFEADLFAMRYVEMLNDFPDGEIINIPSIGQMDTYDYEEGQAIRYTAIDTGNFQFRITDYVASATYITDKMKQDSFYTSRLEAAFVPKQARAIAERMEEGVLAIGQPGGVNGAQTANSLNTINGGDHRFVGSGTSSAIAPQDFARAKYALRKALVPMNNLVAIVDPSVEYTLSTLTNLVNVSFNPKWEGIVRDGITTGMQFKMNIYGFDVYISDWLQKSVNETIDGLSTTTGVANLFFTTEGDSNPFIGAMRQPPKVESERNKDYQRDEYVTTARWGFGFYRPEALVTVLTNEDVVA